LLAHARNVLPSAAMAKTLQVLALLLCLLVAPPGEAKRQDPVDAVHAALVALPAFSKEPDPESPEERAKRLRIVAKATWAAAERHPRGYTRAQWVGVIASVAWHETRLSLYVHAGKCETGPKGMRCDPHPKTGVRQSIGPWQQQRSACPKVWALIEGSDVMVMEAARCASARLHGAMLRCRGRAATPLQGAVSGYAGASCTRRDAPHRERTAWLVAARLGH
jgi:hypothetical protein